MVHLAACKFSSLKKVRDSFYGKWKKQTIGGLKIYLIENNRMLVVDGKESRYYLQQK